MWYSKGNQEEVWENVRDTCKMKDATIVWFIKFCTLHMVSNPTVVSTNWFLRSPFRVTGTPTTCSKIYCPIVYIWKIQVAIWNNHELKNAQRMSSNLCWAFQLSKCLSKLSSIRIGCDTFKEQIKTLWACIWYKSYSLCPEMDVIIGCVSIHVWPNF